LSQGVGARRRLFTIQVKLVLSPKQRAKPADFSHRRRSRGVRYSSTITNAHQPSHCQRLSQGTSARRSCFERHSFLPWKRLLARHPQCTTTQRPEHCATHNELRRGQRTGHLEQVPATHNERRRGQRPKPMPRTNRVPLYHKLPAFALFSAVFFAIKHNSTFEGWGLDAMCLCVEPGLSPCVHKINLHGHT